MMSLKQLLVFSCIIVVATTMAGCAMSDDEIQAYVNSHPEEIQAYVSSHGQQISEYLQQHPEILSEITFPETTTPIVEQAIAEPVSTTEELTETETTQTSEPTPAITETITPTPTVTETYTPTETPTTIPTSEIPTTMETQSESTPIPTTTITTVPTTEATTIQTTVVTTESTPTPTPFTSDVTHLSAIVSDGGYAWKLVSSIDKVTATLVAGDTHGPSDSTTWGLYHGTYTISGIANNAAIIRYDGNPVDHGTYGGTPFQFSSTWSDNTDGTYSSGAIEDISDWGAKEIRTISYVNNGGSEELHISGWPEGMYFVRE